MKKAKQFLMLLFMLLFSVCLGIAVAGCNDPAGQTPSGGGGGGGGANDEDYYIVSVEMVTPPTISNYGEGDVFDPTGMVLKVIWNDGWEQIVTDGQNCIFSPSGEITVDTESITATYDDKTFTLPISVNRMTGISMTSQPARTLYAEGEAFSTTGLKINAVLENGETGKVITDYTLSDNAAALSPTDTKVTVSYAYRDTTLTYDIPVTVVDKDAVITLEAEGGTVVGGEKVTKSSLLQYASGNSFVRNLKAGGTITINVPATKATTASLRFVASSYEDDPEGGAFAIPLQINEVVTVTFNGTEVQIGDDEILPGGYDDSRGTLSRYCHWYEVSLDDVQLNAGNNTFVITSKVNMHLEEDDLHSTLFDCLRVFYADADAIPESLRPSTNANVVKVEAESCVANATTAGTHGAAGSGVSSNFSNGTFVKDPVANATFTLTITLETAQSVTLSMTGVSTSNNSVDIANVVSGLTVNGTSKTYNSGVCFTANGGGYTVDRHSTYTFGTYELNAGENVIVISLVQQPKEKGNAFIDYLTISSVTSQS